MDNKIPLCDRDWFLKNGFKIMEALNVNIVLDNKNDERILELENDKERAKKNERK